MRRLKRRIGDFLRVAIILMQKICIFLFLCVSLLANCRTFKTTDLLYNLHSTPRSHQSRRTGVRGVARQTPA